MSPSVEPRRAPSRWRRCSTTRTACSSPASSPGRSIVSSHVDSALLVPQEALRYLYGVYKVYTVEKSALHETEVKLGARRAATVEIVGGLEDGAQVAVPARRPGAARRRARVGSALVAQ